MSANVVLIASPHSAETLFRETARRVFPPARLNFRTAASRSRRCFRTLASVARVARAHPFENCPTTDPGGTQPDDASPTPQRHAMPSKLSTSGN